MPTSLRAADRPYTNARIETEALAVLKSAVKHGELTDALSKAARDYAAKLEA